MKEKLFQVTIGDQTESYPPGTLFSQIAEAHQHEYDNTIVLVIVDGKLEELYKEVKKNCVLQFVTTAEQIGHKTYERSMCMMMAKAIFDVGGGNTIDQVRVRYNISDGLYCTMHDGREITQEFLDSVKVRMRELVEKEILIHKRNVGTDAAISKEMLQKALSSVVPDTFNMVSVDGDTSTNDTCIVMANGQAGNREIAGEDADYALFRAGLLEVCTKLAKKMAKDGEGATCLFEVKVIHADTKENARVLARSVVSSTLTKAAIAGHDANWGRILCALGYSGIEFDPDKVDLYFESAAGKLQILKDGVSTDYSEEFATEILSCDEITATADMKMGDAEADAWGCDLTHEYVNINADYRS